MKSRVATFAAIAIAGLLLTTPIAETKITVPVPTVQQSIRSIIPTGLNGNGFTIQSAELRSDMIKKLRALESRQPNQFWAQRHRYERYHAADRNCRSLCRILISDSTGNR